MKRFGAVLLAVVLAAGFTVLVAAQQQGSPAKAGKPGAVEVDAMT